MSSSSSFPSYPPDSRPRNPIIHHNNRRAAFHDYRRPGKYMITINKAPAVHPFSRITGSILDQKNPLRVELSDIGKIIAAHIAEVNLNVDFDIPAYVIMPDHIHLLWHVRHPLNRDLGYHIGLFKSQCAKRYNDQIRNRGIVACDLPSIFAPKFNDRIGFTDEIVEKFYNYIHDNPRRRYIVTHHRELFQRVQQVQMGEEMLDVFGNFQLLRDPNIAAVVVSSRYSEEERQRHYREWEETIRCGGVLISPFISEEERRIMKRGIDEGASIIRLLPDGMGEKYKPMGMEFELCAEGRCLHIGRYRESEHKEKLRRDRCLAMNELARRIAEDPQLYFSLIDGRRQMKGDQRSR